MIVFLFLILDKMFKPKALKSQLPDETDFTEHFFHDCPSTLNYHYKPSLRIVSIDPGIERFAMRIEYRNQASRSPIVTEVQVATKLKQFKTNERGENHLYSETVKMLDNYLHLFVISDFIVIERQVPINYQMVRFSQHLISYFMLRLKNNDCRTRIIELNNKIKSTAMNGPKGLSGKGMKKWALAVALQIVNFRQDAFVLNIFSKMKKEIDKYDPADTIVQAESFCILMKFRVTEMIIKHPTIEMDKLEDKDLTIMGNVYQNSQGYAFPNSSSNNNFFDSSVGELPSNNNFFDSSTVEPSSNPVSLSNILSRSTDTMFFPTPTFPSPISSTQFFDGGFEPNYGGSGSGSGSSKKSTGSSSIFGGTEVVVRNSSRPGNNSPPFSF
jgi:hypothetical protein